MDIKKEKERIEQICKPYKPLGEHGSKADYEACLYHHGYYHLDVKEMVQDMCDSMDKAIETMNKIKKLKS